MSLGLMFLTITFGFSLAEGQSAKAALAHIATVAVQEMSVEGGYTAPVQQTLIQDLQRQGFNPQLAQVSVTPSGYRAAYGQSMTLTIAYPFPVHIVDVSAFSVAISDTEGAISFYVPGSPASNDPIISPPGAGTNDLQGTVQGGSGSFTGP
ncbi:MAG: hypothetical protein C7B46_16955 [Sulfobacillus benefaciens]|uniref:DUF3887 domain-containing protein n=1 Tax=Sulfobacillus benefaciens TaxID=453960 RepID=A0A2T2XA24_9FIRM|nr:MAG: hypothetical protein C7B46_16955 [Sulfobacillus benefaciens]